MLFYGSVSWIHATLQSRSDSNIPLMHQLVMGINVSAGIVLSFDLQKLTRKSQTETRGECP